MSRPFRALLDHMAAANPEGKRSIAPLQDARPRANGLKPGDTYGHLQIISRSGASGNPMEWLCACRCGAQIRVPSRYLREATDKCQLCGRPAHDHNR
jgi:hypothetical protein